MSKTYKIKLLIASIKRLKKHILHLLSNKQCAANDIDRAEDEGEGDKPGPVNRHIVKIRDARCPVPVHAHKHQHTVIPPKQKSFKVLRKKQDKKAGKPADQPYGKRYHLIDKQKRQNLLQQ
ncbi:hypothetical protein SDC9_191230 [bioreactor metagenome]|uniref:Uncharacterized protein n=1 Tax=bioreactor metagenome TaxID=1076179 RepID=A0A645HXR6_9ZZZZ